MPPWIGPQTTGFGTPAAEAAVGSSKIAVTVAERIHRRCKSGFAPGALSPQPSDLMNWRCCLWLRQPRINDDSPSGPAPRSRRAPQTNILPSSLFLVKDDDLGNP